jgi:hypothetical protein
LLYLRKIQTQPWSTLFVLSLSAALAVRLLLLIDRYAVNLLFMDEWDVGGHFIEGTPLWRLFFVQHGPHLQGIAFYVTKLIAVLTGWNNRAEAFACGLAVILAMLTALQLKRRLWGHLTFADSIIPLIFLTPLQYGVFVRAPNLAPAPVPLWLMMLYGLSWTHKNKITRYSLVLLFNFLLLFTGYTIFIGMITLFLFGVEWYHDRKNRPRFISGISLVVAIATFAGFLSTYQFVSTVDCFLFPHPRLWEYGWFMGLTWINFFGVKFLTHPTPATYLGLPLVLLVVLLTGGYTLKLFASDSTPSSRQRTIMIFFLTGYSLLFTLNAAVGRVCLSLEVAQTSRYITLMIPAFLGFYFALLSWRSVPEQTGERREEPPRSPLRVPKIWDVLPAKGWQFAFILIYAGLLLQAHVLSPLDRHELEWLRLKKEAWKACYLFFEDVQECNQSTGFLLYPEVPPLQQKLAYLKEHQLNLYLDPPPQHPPPTTSQDFQLDTITLNHVTTTGMTPRHVIALPYIFQLSGSEPTLQISFDLCLADFSGLYWVVATTPEIYPHVVTTTLTYQEEEQLTSMTATIPLVNDNELHEYYYALTKLYHLEESNPKARLRQIEFQFGPKTRRQENGWLEVWDFRLIHNRTTACSP